MTPHTAVGIATVIFYTPVTIYVQFIGFRCWKYGSRMARYMIMIFTHIRLAGGALVISVEKDLSTNNAKMVKATYVLVNLGIVPLLAAYDGFLALTSRENFPKATFLRYLHRLCACLILLSTALLIAAGTMTGKDTQASLQSSLYEVGYFVFLAVYLTSILLSLRIVFFLCDLIRPAHLTIVNWLLVASPFLTLRTAYGILGIFEATGPKMFHSMWSSLFGSATAFALMALLPEYIIEIKPILSESRGAGSH